MPERAIGAAVESAKVADVESEMSASVMVPAPSVTPPSVAEATLTVPLKAQRELAYAAVTELKVRPVSVRPATDQDPVYVYAMEIGAAALLQLTCTETEPSASDAVEGPNPTKYASCTCGATTVDEEAQSA